MPYDLIETAYTVGDRVWVIEKTTERFTTCPMCHGTKSITLRPENGGQTYRCIECYGSGEVRSYSALEWQPVQVFIKTVKVRKEFGAYGKPFIEIKYEILHGSQERGDYADQAALYADQAAAQAGIHARVQRLQESQEISRNHDLIESE